MNKLIISIVFICMLYAIQYGWVNDKKKQNIPDPANIYEWLNTGKVNKSLFDPVDMWIANTNNLLINDLAVKSSPIRFIDFNKDSIVTSIRAGKGPGETSSTFYKRVTTFSNRDILLWDAGSVRISVFTKDLDYLLDIGGSFMERRIYQVGLVNDSTIFTIDNSVNFLKTWRLKDYKIDEEDMLWSISRSDFSEFSALSNFVLLQTLFYTNQNGALYLAFEFSSVIFAIDEYGVKFIHSEPDNIPLPPHDEKEVYSLPVMGKHPEGARDISVDDKYIYLTFSGETTSRTEQIKYSFNFEVLIDKVKHSNRLLIFDKRTGKFLQEEKLPKPAKKLQVIGNTAFLLNTLEEYPTVNRYSLFKTKN